MEDPKGTNRSQYDTTFKDLFKQPPQQLLGILIGRRAVALLPVEFASTQKRLPDLVFLLEDGSIFHLELHGKSEEMAWRMLGYYVVIRQRYPDKILIQKVLYVGQDEWCQPSLIEEPSLQFRCEVVDIRTIDCRELLASPALEENILAILCRMDDRRETIRKILYRISELSPKAKADALTKLVILSRLRKLETVVKTEAEEMALTFNVMENDVLRPLFLKERMDGRQEGRQEGEAALFLRLIQRRFGPAPEWVQAKLDSADLPTLEAWTERILDAESLAAVFQ